MVEDNARVGVIYAVVDVVAAFTVALGLAYHFGYERGGGGDQESARFGENFDIFGEQSFQFGIYAICQFIERLHGGVVGRGKTAANVQECHIIAALLRFFKNVGR